MFRRIPGTAGRYIVISTGETISRRQFERLTRAEALAEREARYHERLVQRRAATAFIPRAVESGNRRYWRRRYAEQMAARRGTNVNVEFERAGHAGSDFNRLWAQAELAGFEGGVGSAWDELTAAAGARGGADDQNERNKYLAVIAWYTRNTRAGNQRWLRKNKRGRFSWPEMGPLQRRLITRLA